MRKTFKVAAIALAATAMLVGCGKDTGEVKVVGPYMTGEKAKTTYNALLTYNLSSLNNAVTAHSEDGQHIANFVDGLLENDNYGRLSKALAETVEVNDAFTEFKFTIKDDIKWMKSDGTQYSANIDGEMVPQVVTAEDFITTLKHNLDYSDSAFWSDTYYLPAMFLQGGWEYWAYTFIQYRLSIGKFRDYYGYYFGDDASLETLANPTPDEVAHNVWCYAYLYGGVMAEEVPTGDDLSAISNFERVGAKVDTQGRLVFSLNSSMPYFTSVLTYSCFLPMNEHFVEEVGYANFGTTKDYYLYNGAYRLSKWNEGEIEYVANPEFWDADQVHAKTVHYTLVSGDIGYDYTRSKFEAGDIDGFTVSQNDTVGWAKYVAGDDESGSLEDPANDDAYARFVEGVDSSFVMLFNMERDESTSAAKQASNLTDEEIVNANRAIKLDAVREILFKGIDLNIYNERYGTSKVYQEQYQIHTYTPRNFAVDSANDKDYVDYVYEAYADKMGITDEEAAAKLRPGQIAGNNATYAELSPIRDQVEMEVAAYNATAFEGKVGNISLPIKVEYLGLSFDDDNLAKDTKWIESANERMNGCTINTSHVTNELPACSGEGFPLIQIVNNTGAGDSEVYSDMGSSGFYNMYIMGWGPDYADPLTYLNTFVTGGDMSGYTNTAEEVGTFSATSATALTQSTLLGEYDEMVETAKAINDDIAQRYAGFAEAEVELIFDAHLIKPLYNLGQGWRVTVTKTIAYEKPTATYGLSENKLKGMWVMKETVGSAKRIEMKAYYDNQKANLDPNYTIYS